MKELYPLKWIALLGSIVVGVLCLAIRPTATDLADATDQPPKELVFVPVKIDGPVHDPAKHTYWFGPEASERLAVLKRAAEETGATENQVVIAWMLHGDPPILPIVAGSRREQLADNIGALDIGLSEDQLRRLDSAGNPGIKQAWLR
jgi:hypothetical protein